MHASYQVFLFLKHAGRKQTIEMVKETIYHENKQRQESINEIIFFYIYMYENVNSESYILYTNELVRKQETKINERVDEECRQ